MILIIGDIGAIVAYAHRAGLAPTDYVPVHIRTAHDALRGRQADGSVIVYVQGADLVLDQPGIRTYVGCLVSLGAGELVGSA